MSTQYPGGFITKSPVAPTSTAASGIWTVDQALQYVKAGTWPVPPAAFIEDLFSTYLYTGNSSTQTITNNINLSARGGLVWIKDRTTVDNHFLSDTAQGTGKDLVSNGTFAATTQTGITAFNTTGFTLGNIANANTNTRGYVAWTFAKQPKFFDIVTYTGTGTARTIAHNLASAPGVIIVKRLNASGAWQVYQKDLAPSQYMVLNTTATVGTDGGRWNSTAATSSVFSVGTDATVNANGGTYVAYLFANNAGGFGASGSENIISSGFYDGTGVAGNNAVTLGYEPQWLLIKSITTTAANWLILDNMRGIFTGGTDPDVFPNLNSAESAADYVAVTATGFALTSASALTNATNTAYIYIAIRRGPMKTPTVGTSVFSPQYNASGATGTAITTNFPVDMQMQAYTGGDGYNSSTNDRLRGVSTNTTQSTKQLVTSASTAEDSPNSTMTNFWNNTGFLKPQYYNGVAYISWNFGRAPGFFDAVCYTGTGAVATQSHNLTVVPEMMIVKKRSVSADWQVYHSALGPTKLIELNLTGSESTSSTRWNDTAPTASVFTVGTHTTVNASAATYVNYLFATLAGISKVGSFTGTAALQTLNCGFTTGARFVLIKRYDAGSTGDWYLWDSARGISSSTDPYLLMNTTAAETTGTNYVDTDTTGFKVTAAASTTVNISAATYIFLAIA